MYAHAPGHVLRVPAQNSPLSWSLPPLHHAALAHQAVKDRLAGMSLYLRLPLTIERIFFVRVSVIIKFFESLTAARLF